MPRELSDLLREATSEAPKARYGVDDVVRAGQRRLKRRQAGWAVAAVVAVAATIGVPQILTPRAAPLTAAPSPSSSWSPAPAPSPSPVPWDQTIQAPKLVHTFRGYSAGKFRVFDPAVWGLFGETAFIKRQSSLGIPEGSTLATLTVFRPGVDTVTGRTKLVETKPIRGRRAFLIEMKPADPTAIIQLGWEYADDGSLAIVTPMRSDLTRADLRVIAEGFTVGDEYPVTVGFRMGYVPEGWKLLQTGAKSLKFTSTKQAAALLAQPDRTTLPPAMGDEPDLMTVGLFEATKDDRPSDQPRCERNRPDCSYYPRRGGPVINILFSRPVVEADAIRVLESVQVKDVPAIEGIPAGARLPGH